MSVAGLPQLSRGAIALAMMLSAGCTRPLLSRQEPVEQSMAALDSVAFTIVMRNLAKEKSVRPLRADPRALSGDPRIISLYSAAIIRHVVGAIAADAHIATGMDHITAMRRDILSELGIAEADAFLDARCPAVLPPPSPEADSLKALYCPKEPYRNAITAIVRQGGPYWPGMVDGRDEYAGQNAVTMRVIMRSLSPAGSVEHSADYVFVPNGRSWKLAEVKELVIIE